MAYLAVAARAALLLVSAVSAAGKLRGRRPFLAFAGSLRPLVPRGTRLAAAALAAAEAGCAVLLLVPATARAGALLAAGVLTVLTLGVTGAVATGRTVACRCFGARTRPLGPVHAVRNALLAALALALAGGLGAGPVPLAGAAASR